MSAVKSAASAPVAIRLGICAFVCFSLLGIIYFLASEKIATAEREALEQRLQEVLADTPYDNLLLNDTLERIDPLLGNAEPKTLWRARLGNKPVAVILSTTAPHGYNGAIDLLVGITMSGTITGVRVISHQETPGLGDAIELRRSEWIKGFDEQSLDLVPTERWSVQRDGGAFDQFTGATITPRAVVHAVHDALRYFQRHKDDLFES